MNRAGADSKMADSVMVTGPGVESSLQSIAHVPLLTSLSTAQCDAQAVGRGTGTEGEQSGENNCTVHFVPSISASNRSYPGKEWQGASSSTVMLQGGATGSKVPEVPYF